MHSFHRCCLSVSLLILAIAAMPARAADKWQTPTPEELSMTSQPQVPGAAAVVLFREEISDDNLSMHSVYVRIKVLTEAGKAYADIELPSEGDFKAEDIAGRTIQPDGTVVPFTGKPYVKTITRGRNVRLEAKVFTMPAVEGAAFLSTALPGDTAGSTRRSGTCRAGCSCAKPILFGTRMRRRWATG